MTPLAQTYLRQGRSFLRLGDGARAAELLERARSLSHDDRQAQQQILQDLVEAYTLAGQPDKASIRQQQLEQLGGPPPIAQQNYYSTMQGTSPQPLRRSRRWVGVLVVLLVLALGANGWFVYRALSPHHEPQEGAPQPTAWADAAQPTESQPSTAATATPSTPPVTVTQTQAQLTSADSELGKLVRETVGLVAVMGRYEGTVDHKAIKLDAVISTGSSFVVTRDGVLLTNKHVVDAVDDAPGSLEDIGLPTLTLREVHYVVCFGPTQKDRVDATLRYKSDMFDVAVLKVDRRFTDTIKLNPNVPDTGQDIIACGYPGALADLFNNDPNNQIHVKQAIAKARRTGEYDDLEVSFSPDAYKPTVTKGIVSARERMIDRASYIQIDARVTPGNSGGPVLNMSHQAVGIATLAGQKDAVGYNFALSLSQLRDELAPYLSGN